jgi:hypothetical protein
MVHLDRGAFESGMPSVPSGGTMRYQPTSASAAAWWSLLFSGFGPAPDWTFLGNELPHRVFPVAFDFQDFWSWSGRAFL